jgi:hypothetical protein
VDVGEVSLDAAGTVFCEIYVSQVVAGAEKLRFNMLYFVPPRT